MVALQLLSASVFERSLDIRSTNTKCGILHCDRLKDSEQHAHRRARTVLHQFFCICSCFFCSSTESKSVTRAAGVQEHHEEHAQPKKSHAMRSSCYVKKYYLFIRTIFMFQNF
jgi:hypothetical protein